MARRQQESQRGRAQRLAVCLLAIWSSAAVAHDVRPSEHGLANQKDPGPASPAMVAFFHARPVAALPEAQNVSWNLVPPAPQGRRHPRSGLLAAGVACVVVGACFLALAAAAYAIHTCRHRSGTGTAWAMGVPRRRNGPEVRLGTP